MRLPVIFSCKRKHLYPSHLDSEHPWSWWQTLTDLTGKDGVLPKGETPTRLHPQPPAQLNIWQKLPKCALRKTHLDHSPLCGL